ncbi:MAG: winged helix-turn-helix transcriptional regulator [Methanosarcinales archaeon]
MKSEISEDIVYDFVEKHDGLSMHEIAKKLGWSVGKVKFAVLRLQKQGLVKTEKEVDYRVKIRVYPTPTLELLTKKARKELKELM